MACRLSTRVEVISLLQVSLALMQFLYFADSEGQRRWRWLDQLIENPQYCWKINISLRRSNHAARVLGVLIGEYNRNGKTMGKAHVAAFRRYGNDLEYLTRRRGDRRERPHISPRLPRLRVKILMEIQVVAVATGETCV